MKWTRDYNLWFYALFGTAVGAGTLFLPIQLGLSGPLAMLVMLLIAFPFTYYPHLGLARYILKSKSPSPSLFSATQEYYGTTVAQVVNGFYALAFLLIIFVYGIAITNSVDTLLQEFWQIHLPRPLLAFLVIAGLHLVFLPGKHTTLKFMGLLVVPLIIYLITLSLTLVSHWDRNNIVHLYQNIRVDTASLKSLWLLMPVMVFAFSHTPIISTFTNHCRRVYNADAELHIKQIMKPSYFMICLVILFFVFSCIFTLSAEDIQITKERNITILSAIAWKGGLSWIALTATPVAIIAMAKSFLGTYFGALEGVKGLLGIIGRKAHCRKDNSKRDKIIGMMVIFCLTLLMVIWNPNTLNVIAVITGPLIALILFILPSISVYLVKPLRPYRSFANLMVLLTGLASFGTAIISIFL